MGGINEIYLEEGFLWFKKRLLFSDLFLCEDSLGRMYATGQVKCLSSEIEYEMLMYQDGRMFFWRRMETCLFEVEEGKNDIPTLKIMSKRISLYRLSKNSLMSVMNYFKGLSSSYVEVSSKRLSAFSH